MNRMIRFPAVIAWPIVLATAWIVCRETLPLEEQAAERELLEQRGIDDIYLMRVEQLYPFPKKALMLELARFPQAEMVWCQEEPKNMGSWFFVEPYIEWVLEQIDAKHRRPRYAGRSAMASTATGLMSVHLAQMQAFLEEALGN